VNRASRVLRFVLGVVGFTLCMSVRDLTPDRFWRGVCAGCAGACLAIVLRQSGPKSVLGIVVGSIAFGVLMGARDEVAGGAGRTALALLAVACLIAGLLVFRPRASAQPRP